MSWLVVGVLIVLAGSYRIYGRWISSRLKSRDSAPTPAHEFCDSVDFSPTHPFYLFGQHFSAIAAAGPIAGPIAACLIWGWVPSLLWIVLGVVFIGAVHDYMTLLMSVRSKAQSVAQMARNLLGTSAGKSFTLFIYLALLYIIVAFTDVTVGSFVTKPDELGTLSTDFHPGGAVAAAGVLYLGLSMLLGVVQRFLNPPLWLVSMIFVPATFGAVWIGTLVSNYFVFSAGFWILALGAYCLLASLAPVWLLLQPRGYLGAFVLYFAIAIGLYGIFFGNFEIQQPAFRGLWPGEAASSALFPFLFVTIACGACSGFHGLVCSGTTSKQIDKESHIHPIGYGAMLSEALVAVIALAMVMMMSPEETQGLRPGTIYGQGIGQSLALILGPEHLAFCITFGAMAFSTFVFDTLDVSVRLGRYLVEELFVGLKKTWVGFAGAAATVLIPTAILNSAPSGSWLQFWTLFGSANQLLAALSLLLAWIWLRQRKLPAHFVAWPSVFVFIITLSSLGMSLMSVARSIWTEGLASLSPHQLANSIVQILLIGLAVRILVAALKSRSESQPQPNHMSQS
jgi:carbon starvation protein